MTRLFVTNAIILFFSKIRHESKTLLRVHFHDRSLHHMHRTLEILNAGLAKANKYIRNILLDSRSRYIMF